MAWHDMTWHDMTWHTHTHTHTKSLSKGMLFNKDKCSFSFLMSGLDSVQLKINKQWQIKDVGRENSVDLILVTNGLFQPYDKDINNWFNESINWTPLQFNKYNYHRTIISKLDMFIYVQALYKYTHTHTHTNTHRHVCM